MYSVKTSNIYGNVKYTHQYFICLGFIQYNIMQNFWKIKTLAWTLGPPIQTGLIFLSLNLVTSAKALLLGKIIHPKVSGIRMWPSLAAVGMILYTSHLYRTQVYKLTSSSKIFYMAQSIESLAQYWIWEHLVIISFGEGNGNPLQYSCLKNSMDSGAWWDANHRVTQSRPRLKQLSMHACIGEGNGNPLQYSCL